MLDLDVGARAGSLVLDVVTTIDASIAGLFGASGAGKTTLLHLIAGLSRPARGRIVLDGATLVDVDARVFVPPHRRRVGVVFQDVRLFPHRTVRGNLRFAAALAPPSTRRLGFDAVVDLLGVGPLVDRRVQGLSGGERQRVAVARAILAAPRLLLMDEPLAAVDHEHRRRLLPLLRRVAAESGIPLVYVTHDPAELLAMTDHFVVLDAGRCVGSGRYLDLAQRPGGPPAVLASGLVNLIEARLVARDADGAATLVPVGGSAPTIHALLGPAPADAAPVGSTLSLVARPEDIAIALAPVERISVRNQWPGVIRRVTDHGHRALLEVDVGVPLLVEVSTGSRTRLDLVPGREVYCLVKAGALTAVAGAAP